ncbi:MAG: serine protein kinase PrkA, partial [Deltaproteobacteria bacterium]
MTKNTETLIEFAGRELGELEPLSFEQYLELLRQKPAGQLRSAAAYLLDTFDYFGSSTMETPTGKTRRFALFDAEFAGGLGKVAGQEQAQQAIYRLLNNFAREGRTTRLILLHGPNGSAKTSIIRAIAQAVEHYATTDEGRMYAFRWIFPAERVARGQIGFSEGGKATSAPSGNESYAHLPASEIEAVLECDCRDHPLLLLPRKLRLKLVEEFKSEDKLAGDFMLPHYLDRGDLCAKCRRIFDSLLASYGGDFGQVLRHVQVLRIYPSLRYRRCMATVEPQMHVDAGEQQVTASRSLASLPPSIAHLALFEFHGPLVDANRGMLEFNDMLKRPVDTFKYLLSTCETGQVALARSTLFVDTVFIASTNELLLDAFKEYPDFVSFKGRLELVRVPYLRKVSEEVEIYRSQFPPSRLGKHLAPHTFDLAALWAVLTRLKKPQAAGFEGELKQVVERLTPIDLAWLYDRGQTPPKLSSQLSRELLASLPKLYRQQGPQYEGRMGASAREVQMILMNAAQQPDRKCVSPLGLFEEVESLLQDKSLYAFLQQQPDGDYQNHPKLLDYVRDYYLDLLEEEAADAMGLVTEKDYL